jgi:hypothetical protein
LSIQFSILLYAQENNEAEKTSYLTIMNRGYEQIERFNIGDSFKLKLKSSKKVEGEIQSILPDHFITNGEKISYDEIKKIRKIKNRTLPIIMGGALITGGIVIIVALSEGNTPLKDVPKIGAVALGMIAAGAVIMTPKYYKIGKSHSITVITF